MRDHPDDHLAERFDAMSDRDKIDFMIETVLDAAEEFGLTKRVKPNIA